MKRCIDSKRERTLRFRLMSVVILLSAGMNFFCRSSAPLPEELTGIWESKDIRYRSTSFEIRSDEIIFSAKSGEVEYFPILKVKKKSFSDNDWDLYTIYYRDDDYNEIEFTFYYSHVQEGLIRFKNQISLVWRKTSLSYDSIQRP